MNSSQSILSAPYFHNEEAAFEYVERALWPPAARSKSSTRGRVKFLQLMRGDG